MSRAQRLSFLGIAVVVAVVAIVLITRGDGTTDTAAAPTPTPSAAATQQQEEASPLETETPEATPTPKPIPTLNGDGVKKLTATQGDTVRFRATVEQPMEIHLHGYDIAKDATPDKPAVYSFKADVTGVFEIEYEDTGQQIGQLSVEPK